MPYAFESKKTKIRKEDDRRRKLTDEDKENIKKMYSYGNTTHRQLAEIYGVNHTLISTIVNEETKKRAVEYQKENRHKWYDKEKQRIYMKRYRENKKKLDKEGRLLCNEDKTE